MKLCRTITLNLDRVITHAVIPLSSLELVGERLLAGPIKLSFDSFRLASLVENPEHLSPDFLLHQDCHVSWSVLISDQMEKKPLFSDVSGARALMLISEVLTSLFEGFHSLGLAVHRATPDLANKHLKIDYVIEKGASARAALGSALCISAMLDALLFVRGLTISSATVLIADEAALGRLEFINLYRFILTALHERTI